MPRFLLVLTIFVGGCAFDARYAEGVACSDGKCPSGLTCHMERCVSMIPIDMAMNEMPPEGPPAALNCADPGALTSGVAVTGTTAGGTSKMSSSCGGFVNNGPDRVYRITMNGTNQLQVHIDSGGRKAYVLAGCIESPTTPACLGNTRASLGSPILVTPAAGPAFVVVDDETAGLSGPYTLRVQVL